ncbi:MAG: V-type ATP synthase subunit F [Candidatus Methanospirareceae archaeon]
MASIAVIGDPDTATGFRLAGVKEVYECEEKEEEVVPVLERLAKEKTTIIIITERLAAKAREKIREINSKKKEEVAPIIIEIPDKRGPIEKEIDEIGRLIKRAIGIAI